MVTPAQQGKKTAKDPRYASQGQALEIKSVYYDRDPYPKLFEASVAPNASRTFAYQNGTEELSEVKRIRVRAHPDVLVSVRRTKDNQDQGVFEQRRVGDLPFINGWYVIEFRSVSADVPLVIEKNQIIKIDVVHTLIGNQWVTIDLDKQAVRFYLAR